MQKRDLVILVLAVAVAIAVAAHVFLGSSLQTGSWGLSFREEGAPPIGNGGKFMKDRFRLSESRNKKTNPL